MAKENPNAVYPNLIETEPKIEIIGSVPNHAVELIATGISSEIIAVHQHYSGFGIKPAQQLPSTTLQVQLYDDESYRQFQNGANTWRYNYVIRRMNGSGILVNAAILEELSGDHGVVMNHEIRHLYVERIVGSDVFASSFPLREGTAGLSIDSTARLRAILEQGNDELYLPLSITHWDRQLDAKETSRRCFIYNPWYLSMFSFFHDYIGSRNNGLKRLIETYRSVPSCDGNLSLAWKKTQPDEPTLEELQKRWLQENGFDRFKIKE